MTVRNNKGQFAKGNNSGKRFQKGQIGYWAGKERNVTWKIDISGLTDQYRYKKNDPRLVGENNPNWANGISKLYQKIRNTWQYNDWQAQCRMRDNYTCQECGKYLKSLYERCSVDHFKKSFAQIIFDNSIITVEDALLCDELWDINNGRVLCWPCHIKTPNYRKRLKRD